MVNYKKVDAILSELKNNVYDYSSVPASIDSLIASSPDLKLKLIIGESPYPSNPFPSSNSILSSIDRYIAFFKTELNLSLMLVFGILFGSIDDATYFCSKIVDPHLGQGHLSKPALDRFADYLLFKKGIILVNRLDSKMRLSNALKAFLKSNAKSITHALIIGNKASKTITKILKNSNCLSGIIPHCSPRNFAKMPTQACNSYFSHIVNPQTIQSNFII